VGHMMPIAAQVRKQLKQIGYNCSLVNIRFIKPMDKNLILELAKEHTLLVTLEENILIGGFGQQVVCCKEQNYLDVQILPIAVQDEYIEHGAAELIRHEVQLDVEAIVKQIITVYAGSSQ